MYDRHDVLVWNEDRQLENEKDEAITEIENEDRVGDDDEIVTDKLISTVEALKSLNTVIQPKHTHKTQIKWNILL